MNIASMLLRILAILGAIAAAVMFFLLGNQKEELQTQLDESTTSLTQTKSQLTTATQERQKFEEQSNALTGEVKELESKSQSLDNQLTRVRQELAEAKKVISTREEEAKDLQSEAGRIRRELLEERNRVAQLQENLSEEDSAALRGSIQALERQLLDTERRLQTIQTQSPEEVAQTNTTKAPAKPTLRGEVTDVGPDSSFIVINLGSNKGVEENSSIMLSRGSRFVARGKVVEVREEVSVARITSGGNPVLAGDSAITLN